MGNNAEALYATIFDTIAQLKNKDEPLDIERAKAISGAVQTAINLAKVEVDHIKATGHGNVTFLDKDTTPALASNRTTTHRLR